MSTAPPKPGKMTSEELQQMLADFYQEVERREPRTGRGSSLAHLDIRYPDRHAGNDFANCSPPAVRQSTNEKNKNTINPLKHI